MKKIIAWSLALIFALSFPLMAFADAIDDVVSLGADLTEAQQKQMLELFNVKEDEVEVLTVTNQEERDYLKGLVGDDKIGTRAISSAYVKLLGDKEGIEVETHNITWVTREIFANAMVTAGIENAKIVAAAPFKVSGTAALTGIMKAFEVAMDIELDEDAKQAANEEMVTTGELGDDVGKDEAASLIKEIKEAIVKGDIKDEGEIRKIVIEIAAKLDITITQAQTDQIVELMKKISNLDLNVEKISSQIEKFVGSIDMDQVKDTINENKGLIKQILEAIENFFAWVRGLLG